MQEEYEAALARAGHQIEAQQRSNRQLKRINAKLMAQIQTMRSVLIDVESEACSGEHSLPEHLWQRVYSAMNMSLPE